jgi:Ohr subfamily peroxiredoxin
VLRAPKELGGPGDGTNPEQLFAIGFAACFESALQGVARRTKQDVGDIAIDSTVTLSPTPARTYQLGVTLDVHLPGIESADAAEALVRAAHEVCPYSNATRGNIDVILIANGKNVTAEIEGAASA